MGGGPPAADRYARRGALTDPVRVDLMADRVAGARSPDRAVTRRPRRTALRARGPPVAGGPAPGSRLRPADPRRLAGSLLSSRSRRMRGTAASASPRGQRTPGRSGGQRHPRRPSRASAAATGRSDGTEAPHGQHRHRRQQPLVIPKPGQLDVHPVPDGHALAPPWTAARRRHRHLDQRRRAVLRARHHRRRAGRPGRSRSPCARATAPATTSASRSPDEAAQVDLGELEPGTYTIADGAGGAGSDPGRRQLSRDATMRRRRRRYPADLCDDRVVNPLDLVAIVLLIVGAPRLPLGRAARRSAGCSARSAAPRSSILGPAVVADPLAEIDPAIRPFVVLAGLLVAVALGESIGSTIGRGLRPGSGTASWAPPTGSAARSSASPRPCSSSGWSADCWPSGRSPA